MTAHSIFNDVIGPVMAGPSSSHSAGCARIGRATRLLWGKEIEKAVVVYDSQGSYPSTCVGQGSNFGFTGGLLGFSNDEPRIKDSVAIARERGVDISFREESLSHRHPNEARIDVFGEDGSIALSVLTLSIGGGMFQIVEMDGFPIFLDGSRMQVFVCCEERAAAALADKLQALAGRVSLTHRAPQALTGVVCTGADRVLLCAEQIADRQKLTEALAAEDGVLWIRCAEVILPIPLKADCTPVFATADGALAFLQREENREKQLWELAVAYECAIGETSEEAVWAHGVRTLDVMKRAALPPDPEQTEQFGFLPYQCARMLQNRETVRTVHTGYLEKAAFYAIAVMENSCAHNIVAAAPTAGSSGVLPGAILAVGEEMGCSRDEQVKGLLAAGLVGAFIANQATFGAEEAGCQAENGAASAMAAAGVVQLLGGSVRQGFAAASMALQNMLGLICDPVGGLTEIPCISRNVSAVANAVQSANMVMLGFDPVIPLDETIGCMYQVGKQLPASLRCTCEGGLCKTKTGLCLAGR